MSETADRRDRGSDAWIGRAIAYMIIVAGMVTAIWLMLRNEPFRDPLFAYALRVFLSLAAGLAVQVIPGMFRLRISERGRQLTATGAIGFAALTFFSTPVMAPNLDPEKIPREPPPLIPCRVWTLIESREGRSYGASTRPASLRGQWLSWIVARLDELEGKDELIEKLQAEPNPEPADRVDADASEQADALQGLTPEERQRLHAFDAQSSTENGKSKPPPAPDKKLLIPKTVVAESPGFPNPYVAFNAMIRTIPARDPTRASASHDAVAFLVHGEDTRKSFTPLVSVFSPELQYRVVHVPESRKGDYLLFLLVLKPREGAYLNEGELIPLILHVL